MKILHTADWHLGKRLEKISRLPEQLQVIEEIVDIANEQDVDAVLIAGDLFDNFNPATEAVELFYRTLKKLSNNGKRPVIAIAGNHDSPDRVEVPDVLARECGIILAGYPHTRIKPLELESGIKITKSESGFIEIQFPQYNYPLRLIITPYANEYRLKTFLGVENPETSLREVLNNHWQQLADKYCDENGVNILLTHLYMMKKGEIPPEEPEDEKPILHVGGAQAIYSENIPKQVQYTALGHLHRFQQIDKEPCPVVYSSSPLCYSFAEAGQEKYVIIVEAEPASAVKYEKIPLKKGRKLYRKKFENTDDALLWLAQNPEALVELTLVTDDYLKADERKRLYQQHDGIVSLIPQLKNIVQETEKRQTIDLNEDMENLFIQYFKFRNGQTPNEDLLALFKEIRAEQITE